MRRIVMLTIVLVGLGLALFASLSTSAATWTEGACPPAAESYCTISQGAFLTFGPNGKYLAVVLGGKIRILDIADGSVLRSITAQQPWMSFGIPGFSPDGKLLAAPMSGDLIGVWNVASGENLLTIPTPTGPYLRVEFSPTGGSLASISGGRIDIWDITSGALIESLQNSSAPLITLAFSPDGSGYGT